jgi:DNA-binding MarR family transcriptional regulator
MNTHAPTDETPWYEIVGIAALMRHARAVYGTAMREALTEAGYDDIPKNGLYIIGGLALGAEGVPLGRLGEELGVSKQAVGQLVDTLVLRGYLARTVDEADRRKLTITLTERGRAAAEVQKAAGDAINAKWAERIGDEGVLKVRRSLAALIALGRPPEEH